MLSAQEKRAGLWMLMMLNLLIPKGLWAAGGSWYFHENQTQGGFRKRVTVRQEDRKMTSAICPAQGSTTTENGHNNLQSM